MSDQTYLYTTVHELHDLIQKYFTNTDRFVFTTHLPDEKHIQFIITDHDEVILDTTCSDDEIYIPTYDLPKDVQTWFTDQWYQFHRKDIFVRCDSGSDVILSNKVLVTDPCYRLKENVTEDTIPSYQYLITNLKSGTWHTEQTILNVNNWGDRVGRLDIWHESIEKPMDSQLTNTDKWISVDSGTAGIVDFDHMVALSKDDESFDDWYDRMTPWQQKLVPLTADEKAACQKIYNLNEKKLDMISKKGTDDFDEEKLAQYYHETSELRKQYWLPTSLELCTNLSSLPTHTYREVDVIATDEHTVISHAGMGDGSYPCYTMTKDGEVVAITIDYLGMLGDDSDNTDDDD